MTGIDIAVVSDRLHSVHGEPVLDPICATLSGPTTVIPKEFPGITCRNIDIDLNSEGMRAAGRSDPLGTVWCQSAIRLSRSATGNGGLSVSSAFNSERARAPDGFGKKVCT